MIENFTANLGSGVSLSCRRAGPAEAPLLLFLHGFPEGAFVWDEMMLALASRFRCVAPNLRGYDESFSPGQVEAYKPRTLADDIVGLVEYLDAPVAALVAHDWGGVVGWSLGALAPPWLERLVIINSPHPATFLRELQQSPAQQQASAYMNFLCLPQAAAMLVADDYARLWKFFTAMGAEEGTQPGAGWLNEKTREEYRLVWAHGIEGALNYYRASPLRPPTSEHDPVMSLQLPPALTQVRIPTLVLWAEADTALPPALLDGLSEYVEDLVVVRIPEATHWVVHEQPDRLVAEIRTFLGAAISPA